MNVPNVASYFIFMSLFSLFVSRFSSNYVHIKGFVFFMNKYVCNGSVIAGLIGSCDTPVI